MLGLAPLGLLQACGDKGSLCFDPDTLGAGEMQMRSTLEYVDVSASADQCKSCQFYHDRHGGCGECELLDGPVAVTGHCTSFAIKL